VDVLTRNECPDDFRGSTASYQINGESTRGLKNSISEAAVEQTRTWTANICLQPLTEESRCILTDKSSTGTALIQSIAQSYVLTEFQEQCFPCATPLQRQENRPCGPPQRPMAPVSSNILSSRSRRDWPVCLSEIARVSKTTRIRMG
jgi:hypothetical protein